VLLSQIALDRQGQVINKSALRSCTSMLSILRSNSQEDGPTVYKTDFESPFLEETGKFYDAESNNLLLNGTAPDYLSKVERRLLEEDDRVHHYLHPSTEPALLSLLEHTLIATKLPVVLNHSDGGLPTLIDQKRNQDLARLYRLSARVGGGHMSVRKALKVWIIKAGQQLADSSSASVAAQNADEEDGAPAADPKGKGKEAAPTPAVAHALGWVASVLQLKDNMDLLWREAWEEDLAFQTSIVEVRLALLDLVFKLKLPHRLSNRSLTSIRRLPSTFRFF
jgi:cullin 3